MSKVEQEKIEEAKKSLDTVINKGRVHLYKPIQIAEILYQARKNSSLDLSNLEEYRTKSRHWRDDVSLRLVGSKSTSSARYQDDVFNENAVPPGALVMLDKVNKERKGLVESYIYYCCQKKWKELFKVKEYLQEKEAETFNISEILTFFEEGLATSMDKAYEVTVYSLFSNLIDSLGANISLSLSGAPSDLVEEFSDFSKRILSIPEGKTNVSFKAEVYRAGVANAADTGIDIVTNFGTLIQIKHVSLTAEETDKIASKVESSQIVIVCKDQESEKITNVLESAGFGDRIQAIITRTDLKNWYEKAMEQFPQEVGVSVLSTMKKQLNAEFPFVEELPKFLEERNYSKENLEGMWVV